MSGKTLEALKASIAKWERNAEAKTPDDYLVGAYNCPLCDLFNRDDQDDGHCIGCPVHRFTGVKFCKNTPYDDADASHTRWWQAKFERSSPFHARSSARKAARAEVKFLKSLLPKDQSDV